MIAPAFDTPLGESDAFATALAGRAAEEAPAATNAAAPARSSRDLSAVLPRTRLLDAAPALLTACRKMLRATGGSAHWQGRTREALEAIEAAIALAAGAPVFLMKNAFLDIRREGTDLRVEVCPEDPATGYVTEDAGNYREDQSIELNFGEQRDASEAIARVNGLTDRACDAPEPEPLTPRECDFAAERYFARRSAQMERTYR